MTWSCNFVFKTVALKQSWVTTPAASFILLNLYCDREENAATFQERIITLYPSFLLYHSIHKTIKVLDSNSIKVVTFAASRFISENLFSKNKYARTENTLVQYQCLFLAKVPLSMTALQRQRKHQFHKKDSRVLEFNLDLHDAISWTCQEYLKRSLESVGHDLSQSLAPTPCLSHRPAVAVVCQIPIRHVQQ